MGTDRCGFVDSPITVRHAVARDAAEIETMLEDSLGLALPRTLNRLRRGELIRGEEVLTAKISNTVVGVIIIEPARAMLDSALARRCPPDVINHILDRYRTLTAVAVADGYRHRNIGRLLVLAAARALWVSRQDRLLYGQYEWDPHLRRFYRSLGFKSLGPAQPLAFSVRSRVPRRELFPFVLRNELPEARWFVGKIDGFLPRPTGASMHPVKDPFALHQASEPTAISRVS